MLVGRVPRASEPSPSAVGDPNQVRNLLIKLGKLIWFFKAFYGLIFENYGMLEIDVLIGA